MDDTAINELLRTYDRKLENALKLNIKNVEEIQKLKAISALRPVKGVRYVGIILGVIWVAFLVVILLPTFLIPLVHGSFRISRIFFVGSVLIHLIVSAIAIGVYIKHLVLIRQFDNSRTVIEAQQKLVMLMTSNLRILRLLLVQLPVFFTFFITLDWIGQSPLTFWLIQAPLVLLATYTGVWFYRNLQLKNQHKKWFRLWMSFGGEGEAIKRATELLNEIEEFKKEGSLLFKSGRDL